MPKTPQKIHYSNLSYAFILQYPFRCHWKSQVWPWWWSKYLLVLVHAWTGPLAIYIQNLGSCSHFSVLPLSLQHEQELQPAPALPSPALHSAAAAWCTDLLFNCAMWSLKDFFPPSLLLNSQDEIGFWSATLFSSSLPWGRVAKKDFCFVPFCLQSSG